MLGFIVLKRLVLLVSFQSKDWLYLPFSNKYMAIYEFNGFKPVIDESAFIHPLAAVTGNVIIGKDV